MKDNLEKYIAEHRNELDMFDPDEQLWKGIKSRISPKRPFRITARGILWRAAAVAVIFMASFALQHYLMRNNTRTASRDRGVSTDAIPELKEAEVYYTTLVNEKLSEIQPMLEDFPGLGEELRNDLHELDSIYDLLRSDLADNIANDEIVEAMIQNYRLKLEILEDLQDFLQERAKPEENENQQYDI